MRRQRSAEPHCVCISVTHTHVRTIEPRYPAQISYSDIRSGEIVNDTLRGNSADRQAQNEIKKRVRETLST